MISIWELSGGIVPVQVKASQVDKISVALDHFIAFLLFCVARFEIFKALAESQCQHTFGRRAESVSGGQEKLREGKDRE